MTVAASTPASAVVPRGRLTSIWWHSRLTPAWWLSTVAASVLFGLNLVGLVGGGAPASVYAYLLATVFVFATGLTIWAKRPQFNPLGPLWTWGAILALNENLPSVHPTSKAAILAGLVLAGWAPTMGGQFVLSYPTGKLPNRWAKRYLIVAYLVPLWTWPFLFFTQPSYLYVGPPPFSLLTFNRVFDCVWLVPQWITVWLLYLQRLRSLAPGARRTVAPLLIAVFIHDLVFFPLVFEFNWTMSSAVFPFDERWLLTAALFVFSLLAISGLFWTWRARGVVGDLVLDLGRLGPGGVREALARALGDPTVRVGYWLPDGQLWADEDGTPLEFPAEDDESRAVTLVGDRLAVMIHDPDLLDQPALLESVRSAAAFALENERLRAQLLAQLEDLRESRARIVRSADEERRRLERDLHDGAQQRLLGVGMALQLLHDHVDKEGDGLLGETEAEVQQALHELRELARGIHPAILTDSGLGEAIRTLARRAPVPVEVDADGERFPAPVETAAYYVVAEALTNVAKYAHATQASVSVQRDDGHVRIDIRDDGVGGANPAGGGTGLRGLADRVGALDGSLSVDSPVGVGTHVAVEIPCPS